MLFDIFQVFLHSMHKYVIRITLQKRNKVTAEVEKFTRFLLQETNFIAVTAYQNSKITHLKILNNPFAKAFRGDKPRSVTGHDVDLYRWRIINKSANTQKRRYGL